MSASLSQQLSPTQVARIFDECLGKSESHIIDSAFTDSNSQDLRLFRIPNGYKLQIDWSAEHHETHDWDKHGVYVERPEVSRAVGERYLLAAREYIGKENILVQKAAEIIRATPLKAWRFEYQASTGGPEYCYVEVECPAEMYEEGSVLQFSYCLNSLTGVREDMMMSLSGREEFPILQEPTSTKVFSVLQEVFNKAETIDTMPSVDRESIEKE